MRGQGAAEVARDQGDARAKVMRRPKEARRAKAMRAVRMADRLGTRQAGTQYPRLEYAMCRHAIRA